MKTIKTYYIVAFVLISIGAVSCKKNDTGSLSSTSSSSSIASAISSLQAIGIGTTSPASTSAADSIYAIHTCSAGDHRDSIGFVRLPSNITSYLTTNYSGYTAEKAFTVKDSSGTLKDYIVIISYNGNPLGLKFDASGNFVSVLEQREGSDMEGQGWHDGGHFDDRGGHNRDTVAVNNLPTIIQSYFASNYPQDTIVKAYQERDSSYVVISKDNGVFATIFSSTGSFVKRVDLPSPSHGSVSNVTESDLPALITSYLATTYPAYVFKEAFSVSLNGVLQGYIVYIIANSTHYAVAFDASGSFIKAKAVR